MAYYNAWRLAFGLVSCWWYWLWFVVNPTWAWRLRDGHLACNYWLAGCVDARRPLWFMDRGEKDCLAVYICKVVRLIVNIPIASVCVWFPF